MKNKRNTIEIYCSISRFRITTRKLIEERNINTEKHRPHSQKVLDFSSSIRQLLDDFRNYTSRYYEDLNKKIPYSML